MRTNRFWLDYFAVDEEQIADSPGFEFRLPIAQDGDFVLVQEPQSRKVRLAIHVPRLPHPTEIAREDEGPDDFKPHVLRWEELRNLSGCLVQRDPATYPAPIPFVLLYRFAPITTSDEAVARGKEISQALSQLGVLSHEEVSEIWELTVHDAWDCQWVRDTDHNAWVLDGDAQSLRIASNDDFPFQDLEQLLAAAARCAGAGPAQ